MAPTSSRHAPQSDHRQTRRAQERGKAHPAKTRRSGMGACRIERGEEERGGARSLRRPYLAPIMHRRSPEARRMRLTVMGSVCPPAPSHMLVSCQQQDQPSPSGLAADGIK